MLRQFVSQNQVQLDHIVAILLQVDIADYQKILPLPTKPSLGQHIRHILDHYAQLKQALLSGQLDYRKRARNPLLATQPEMALASLQQQLAWLAMLSEQDLLRPLVYCCSEGEGQTSLARELDFLASHTVHHLALLHILLSQLGYPLPDNMGVHSSTLEYLKCAP